MCVDTSATQSAILIATFNIYAYTYIYVYIHLNTYMHLYACVCVYMPAQHNQLF